MKKKSILYTLLAIACFIGKAYPAAADGDCNFSDACEQQGDWRITDPMAGVIDGKNGVFTLSRTPALGASISIFRNGLKLQDAADYKVLGNQVVMIGASIPQPGDYLRALYTVAPRIAAPAMRSTSVSAHPDTSTGGDIAATALRDALNAELRGHEASTVPSTTPSESSAIRMLQNLSGGTQSSAQRGSSTISGFDGLGDNYSFSSTGRGTTLANGSLEGRPNEQDALNSIRMLKEQLQDGKTAPRSSSLDKKTNSH